jgi:hypothetical protein
MEYLVKENKNENETNKILLENFSEEKMKSIKFNNNDSNNKYNFNKEFNDIIIFRIFLNNFSCLIQKIILLRNKLWEYLLSLKDNSKRNILMKTPCNHLFHTECLEKWIQFKTECPYCRRDIPNIE